jgi:tellurite methyltransferase
VQENTNKNVSWDDCWQEEDILTNPWWTVPSEEVIKWLPRLQSCKAKRVLDLGCGIGRHVEFFLKHNFEVHGMDYSFNALTYCKENVYKKYEAPLKLARGDMIRLPYSNNVFDFAILYNVIYHQTLNGIQSILSEAMRVLQKGAHIFVNFPTPEDHRFGFGEEVEYNTFQSPKAQDSGELHHFSTEDEIKKILKNFRIIDLQKRVTAFERNGEARQSVYLDVFAQI